ncbi:calcium-binding protein P-like [Gigantopelta aegis]|uniref:calcium-binding protein P-like n=1 Tax=Gigantopelta aegis TaxID=1735272 RepID=UPI001B88A853|nr:calcium-binding protein P-like [Gigantopelta aegis]
MAEVVKSGYLKRFSKGILDGGWNNVWVVLHKDSNLVIYKKQGDTSPKGHVLMKEVCKHFAYGTYTDGMPERPELPKGGSIDNVLAIPSKPSSKAKIHWFYCPSQDDLHAWMSAICSTLPPPKVQTQPQAQPPTSVPVSQPIQVEKSTNVSSLPPYPGGPPQPVPGGIGFTGFEATLPPVSSQPNYAAPPAYPAQPGYAPPQQPYPQAYAQYPPPPQYNQQAYPQQQYYQQQPGPVYPRQQYAPPPQGYAQPGYTQYQQYPQGQYAAPGYAPPQYAQQQPNVVYVDQKKKGGILSSNTGKTAAALIGGAALGYGATRMMGGGLGMMGGGWGCGRWGSWSSFSSFSGGSFGSWSS